MANLRVNDFSGGETDRFRDGNPKFAQRMRNLLISENKRAISRPGFSGLYADERPFGNQQGDMLFTHRTTKYHQPTSYAHEYETFIISNGAVRVQNNTGTGGWRTVRCTDGGTDGMSFVRQDDQMNYTRLSDNEFIISGNSIRRPIKFIRQDAISDWMYTSLGLPKLSNPLVVTPNGVASARRYVYALVVKHEYKLYIDNELVTKIVRGSPQFSAQVIDGDLPTVVTVPQFNALTVNEFEDNSGEDVVFGDTCFSYYRANPGSDVYFPIVYELYRTLDKGNVFYLLSTSTALAASNGDSLNGSLTDATLATREKLYTTGGVVPNGMPSNSPIMSTVSNSTLWLASKNNVWQAKVGIPDAAPGSFVFSARSGETITAINTMDIYPIVFTTLGVYRVEGLVSDQGYGTHTLRTISETGGALSNRTTIKADDRIYYLSNDGVYMTNGYTATKVTAHYNTTYASIINRATEVVDLEIPAAQLMRAAWDRVNRRVYWFYPKGGVTTYGLDHRYNSQVLVLDLKFKNEEGFCVTSGDLPYSLTDADCNGGNLQIITRKGFVLGQNEANLADEYVPWVNDTNPANAALENPLHSVGVAWDYISTSLSFGSSLGVKWFTRILLHMTNLSDITCTIQSDTDESNDYRSHNPIAERGFTRGLYFLKRWFPKGRLRGTYKTIRITNDANQILFKSDDYDLVDCSVTTGILVAGTWPSNMSVGNFIYFSNSYTFAHRVKSISGNTITYEGTTTGTGRGWIVRGIPLDEKLELNGYTIDYSTPGEAHTQSGVEGGNA